MKMKVKMKREEEASNNMPENKKFAETSEVPFISAVIIIIDILQCINHLLLIVHCVIPIFTYDNAPIYDNDGFQPKITN